MKTMVILLFLLSSFTSFASDNNKKKKKETSALSGVIVNFSDNEPLTGVRIDIKELEKTFYTGIDGDFNISNLPIGEYSLTIQHPSFSEKIIKGVVLKNGSALTIKLFPN